MCYPKDVFRDLKCQRVIGTKPLNVLDDWPVLFRDHSRSWLALWELIMYAGILNIKRESRPSFWASHSAFDQGFDCCLPWSARLNRETTANCAVDWGDTIMSVDVKHPLDAASTDLLEVSRHRLEPLSTKMEERDADVMKVRLTRFFSKIGVDRLLVRQCHDKRGIL